MDISNREFIAHARQKENGEWDDPHLLEEHLRDVAKLTAKFSQCFQSSDWGELAGLWHDLGKYRPKFQDRIRLLTGYGYDAEAHLEQQAQRVDHSTAGAIHAIKTLGPSGRLLAYLIAGHHAGLPDWNMADAGDSSLMNRLANGERDGFLKEAIESLPPEDILNPIGINSKPLGGVNGLHLWMRMLFSCLVDADFLDTEAYMSPDKTIQRDDNTDIFILKNIFDDYMRGVTVTAENTSVNKLRESILHDCRVAAENSQGIYTLTVPTGGGKTLSAMAFALGHAVKHNLKRIIVVIPYTSIIEQTAEQYRKIFGDIVVEHHSNLDPERETAKSRLSSENWDASIIVTTNVQLLESLFAAKTSRCRKLHNIVDSVIVIDEAQLLPPNFFQPILDTFQLLVSHYGVTLVLSTATQPALASRKDAFGKVRLRGIDNAREIISDVPALYMALNRVKVEKPIDMSIRVSWEQLAEELRQHQSVLVIVNTRKDCRALFDLMPQGTIHLSALMCGEHRSRVIADIKRNLKEGKLVRVISTQLVEAGVDVDFPVVYRALAGLDSIAQAAGRCNREGKLKNDQGEFVKGRVVVFVPPNAPPRGMLTFGEQATKSVWYSEQEELLSNDIYTKYFQLYFGSVDNDEKNINLLLTKDAGDLVVQFRSAADKFRLIDDKNTVSILVPYDDKAIKLIETLRFGNVSKGIFRRLQRYCVTIYEHDFVKLQKIKAIEQLQLDVWSVCATNMYSNEYGLLLADDLYSIDAII